MPTIRLKNDGRIFSPGGDLPDITNTPIAVTSILYDQIVAAINTWNDMMGHQKVRLILEIIDPSDDGVYVSGDVEVTEGLAEFNINGDIHIVPIGDEGVEIGIAIIQDDVGNHSVTIEGIGGELYINRAPFAESMFYIGRWASKWRAAAAGPFVFIEAVPTFDLAGDFNNATRTFTIPDDVGVIYFKDDVLIAPGVYAGNLVGTYTITAEPGLGYQIDGDAVIEWDMVFTPFGVNTTAPTFNDTGNVLTIPAVTGIQYKKNGTNIAAGTYNSQLGGLMTITAVAASSEYTINVGQTVSWPHTFPVVIPSGAYDDAVLADSPLTYLPLNDTVGTTAPVSSGAETWASVGTTFGATGIGDGTTSADMDGSTSVITSSAQVITGLANGSAEAIIVPDTVGGSFREIVGVAIQTFLLAIEGGNITGFLGNTAGNKITGPALVAGTRYHVAMTYDGANLKIYVNGGIVGTQARTGSIGTSASALRIGYAGLGRYDGKVAGVALYNSALSAARVLAHAQAAGLA